MAVGMDWALKMECDEEWGKRPHGSTLVSLSFSVEWVIKVVLRQY
jgi:hypothetical protein